MKCGHCSRVMAPGALFCPQCGAKARGMDVPDMRQPAKVFCPKCGRRLPRSAQLCMFCGASMLPRDSRGGSETPIALHTEPAAVAPHIAARTAAPDIEVSPSAPRKSR